MLKHLYLIFFSHCVSWCTWGGFASSVVMWLSELVSPCFCLPVWEEFTQICIPHAHAQTAAAALQCEAEHSGETSIYSHCRLVFITTEETPRSLTLLSRIYAVWGRNLIGLFVNSSQWEDKRRPAVCSTTYHQKTGGEPNALPRPTMHTCLGWCAMEI